jgi:ATP-dependent Clp protease ATP-binding subunit ClpA
MDAGEKQLREIFEKNTINNINAIIVYNQLTEELVKKLEKQVKDLDGIIRQYEVKFENMQKQLAAIQTRVYRGGT